MLYVDTDIVKNGLKSGEFRGVYRDEIEDSGF